MPRGQTSKHSAKQQRQAEHVEESYQDRGVPAEEAEHRAWATVSAQTPAKPRARRGTAKKTAAPKTRRAAAKKAAGTRRTRAASKRTASAKRAAPKRAASKRTASAKRAAPKRAVSKRTTAKRRTRPGAEATGTRRPKTVTAAKRTRAKVAP